MERVATRGLPEATLAVGLEASPVVVTPASAAMPVVDTAAAAGAKTISVCSANRLPGQTPGEPVTILGSPRNRAVNLFHQNRSSNQVGASGSRPGRWNNLRGHELWCARPAHGR